MGFDDEEFEDEDPFERLVDDVGERIISRSDQFRIGFLHHIVNAIVRDFGEPAIMDLLLAVDRVANIETEILADRPEVENILLERHGAFDGEIWEKIQETEAWEKMRVHVFRLTKRYLESAIDEVVQQEL